MTTIDAEEFPAWQLLLIGSISLVVVTITLLLGLTLVGGVTDGVSEPGPPENRTSAAPFTDNAGNLKDGLYDSFFPTFVSFQATGVTVGDVLEVYSVNDSTGNTVKFSANDSRFEADDDVELEILDTWAVSTWGEWNNSHDTTNGTLVSLDGRVLIQYDNETQEWVGWWFDEATRNSYRVSVAAQQQPGSLEHIVLQHNGTHLEIYRNNTLGDTADTTVDSSADPILNADNWAGRIEETRGYNESLTSSQRQQLRDDPVLPLTNVDRTFRLQFDSGSGSSEPLFFSGTSVTLFDTSWTSGHNGTVLTEGTDYELQESDGDISPNSGGRLEEAPTAYVFYEFEPSDFVSGLIPGIRGGFQLFASAILVIPAAAIIAALIGSLLWAVRAADRVESPFDNRRGGR